MFIVFALCAHTLTIAIAMPGMLSRAVAVIWSEFVRELRFHWDHGLPFPRLLSHASPDTRFCLLHQKLQMLYQCILAKNRTATGGMGAGMGTISDTAPHTRRARRARHASSSSTASAAMGSNLSTPTAAAASLTPTAAANAANVPQTSTSANAVEQNVRTIPTAVAPQRSVSEVVKPASRKGSAGTGGVLGKGKSLLARPVASASALDPADVDVDIDLTSWGDQGSATAKPTVAPVTAAAAARAAPSVSAVSAKAAGTVTKRSGLGNVMKQLTADGSDDDDDGDEDDDVFYDADGVDAEPGHSSNVSVSTSASLEFKTGGGVAEGVKCSLQGVLLLNGLPMNLPITQVMY